MSAATLAILELIIIGAKIFSDERKDRFQTKARKLMEEIQEVEDSDFYSKDMEAKGKAERELHTRSEAVRVDFVKEATK